MPDPTKRGLCQARACSKETVLQLWDCVRTPFPKEIQTDFYNEQETQNHM